MFQMQGYRPMAMPQGISLGYRPQIQQIGSPQNALALQRLQLPQSMLAPTPAAPQPVSSQTRPMLAPTADPYQYRMSGKTPLISYGSRR